jgi:hypothetical protein
MRIKCARIPTLNNPLRSKGNSVGTTTSHRIPPATRLVWPLVSLSSESSRTWRHANEPARAGYAGQALAEHYAGAEGQHPAAARPTRGSVRPGRAWLGSRGRRPHPQHEAGSEEHPTEQSPRQGTMSGGGGGIHHLLPAAYLVRRGGAGSPFTSVARRCDRLS